MVDGALETFGDRSDAGFGTPCLERRKLQAGLGQRCLTEVTLKEKFVYAGLFLIEQIEQLLVAGQLLLPDIYPLFLFGSFPNVSISLSIWAISSASSQSCLESKG